MYLGGVVVVGREPQVALVEVPDAQRMPTCHHNPLADVKLLTQNYHRVLNVLLNDPDGVKLRGLNSGDDVFELRVNGDTAAPGFATGFQNPSILGPNDRILVAQDRFETIQHLANG